MGGSPQLARLSHQQKTSGLQKKSQWHNCIDMSARAPFVLCARYFLNQDLETLNFFFFTKLNLVKANAYSGVKIQPEVNLSFCIRTKGGIRKVTEQSQSILKNNFYFQYKKKQEKPNILNLIQALTTQSPL